MRQTRAPGPSARDLSLVRSALARPRSPFLEFPPRALLVDASLQRLVLLEAGRPSREYPISTAATGVGGESGSFRTPPGWHRIHARIGAGAAPGTVFESREATGQVWRGEPSGEDLILTRVLTLEGLEDGVNRGPGCDSLDRTIYIHGTNHPEAIGRPVSHGCVRMTSADIVDLFERIEAGDPVVVLEETPNGLA